MNGYNTEKSPKENKRRNNKKVPKTLQKLQQCDNNREGDKSLKKLIIYEAPERDNSSVKCINKSVPCYQQCTESNPWKE